MGDEEFKVERTSRFSVWCQKEGGEVREVRTDLQSVKRAIELKVLKDLWESHLSRERRIVVDSDDRKMK